MTCRIPAKSTVIGLCLLVAVAMLSEARGAVATEADPTEVRALWVTHATLGSPETIDRMVGAARDAGFNTGLKTRPPHS
jgi:uncharacterized lipoprotein YddW (UPF0748 family)